MLHQTSHASALAAPLSLLVDSFGLPCEGFLTHGAFTVPEAQETLLHPVKNGELLNAISLPVDVLASLTREVVLPVENCVLDNVDVIDIPAIPEENTPLMMQAKCLWLLEHYRQHIQPDVLGYLQCNGAPPADRENGKAPAKLGQRDAAG